MIIETKFKKGDTAYFIEDGKTQYTDCPLCRSDDVSVTRSYVVACSVTWIEFAGWVEYAGCDSDDTKQNMKVTCTCVYDQPKSLMVHACMEVGGVYAQHKMNGTIKTEKRIDEDELFADLASAKAACAERNAGADDPLFGFIARTLEELEKAEKKHPYFADYVDTSFPKVWKARLDAQRKLLADSIANRDVPAFAVIVCELLEFMDACAQEDWKAAVVELAQVGAVLIRTARMVQAKIDDQDGGGA